MTRYEYKVIPAPNRGEKARGVKGGDARFAHALERAMNAMARDGWEFQRAETLPCEERQGLTGTAVTFRHMLVFRREKADAIEAYRPRLLEKPKEQAAEPAPAVAPPPAPAEPLALTDPLPERATAPPPAANGARPLPSVMAVLQSRAASLNGRKDGMAAE